jgi:alpha-galactosidase
MNRKQFLRISGVSLSGLIFNYTSGGFFRHEQIVLPDEVWIQSGINWYRLSSSSALKYIFEDVEVMLKHTNEVLGVSVNSPTKPLNAITLKWKYPLSSNDKFLGDAWERTYGDVSWQSAGIGKKMPWYFIQHDNNNTNCFGVKTGCNSICYWYAGSDNVQLILDTNSAGAGVQLGFRTLHAADIITTKNKPGETLFATSQRFCKLMCDKPRLPKQPVYGINDWYFTYGNNSADLILKHTSLLAGLATNNENRPFSVIDAGWASYSPLLPGDCCWQDDFSRPNDKFKDMDKLATKIENLGMRPALWTRPLCASYKTNANLLLPKIRGRNDPKQPVLDPSIEENIAHIKSNISLYNQWGYKMVKHDFTTFDILGRWGFEMKESLTPAGWKFYDNSKTNAEIILHLYTSIREAAGDMYLIGCNTLSHLSTGLFELNRIGDDTSGKEWERTRKMGVNTLAFRSIQHQHFYSADADCVGLTNQVPWNKNKQWMHLLAESSTPLFISAQPDALGTEQKEFIKKSFDSASKPLPVCEPLDWMQTNIPSKWKLNGEVVTFDWG